PRKLADKKAVAPIPCNPRRRAWPLWRQIVRLSARCGHNPDVPTRRTLIAHQPADKSDRLSVRRPARYRDLQPVKWPCNRLGIEDSFRRTSHLLRIQLRHPPVVLARRIGCNIRKRLGIRRPVEFVDVKIGWG